MACRLLLENPAPQRQAVRGEDDRPVDVTMDEGIETIRYALSAGLRLDGVHHSDLDPYEARQLRARPAPRYDSLEYACHVHICLADAAGLVIPHRVIVYESPEDHLDTLHRMTACGIHDLVLVGTPFSTPPPGAVYRNSVERMLAFLQRNTAVPGLHTGAVVLHERDNETARLVRKFMAAGQQHLRLMGQFLDDARPMLSFMESVTAEFHRQGLDVTKLEWNVGLAIFALRQRDFYAKLLRKQALACEQRLSRADSAVSRVRESIRMNLEFAELIRERAEQLGLDIGFSLQPILERTREGRLHPGVEGVVELGMRLREHFG